MKRLAWLAALFLITVSAAPAPVRQARGVPPLVFVSRQPLPVDDAYGGGRGVPGFGPRDRARAAGGRLMARRADGRVAPLLEDGAFFDVSDPSVSWDGRRIVFAGLATRRGSWRIWTVGADGRGLVQVTRDDRPPLALASFDGLRWDAARYDDLDPCWLPDGRICFASTRYPQVAERGGGPVTNLFVVDAVGGTPGRITTERNGAEEPAVDPATGRIVYTRWWFNRWRPSDEAPDGVTADTSLAIRAKPVDVWHAVSVLPDGDGVRLAGGNPRVRAEMMAYQPVLLHDGTLIGVDAQSPSLIPDGGALTVVCYPRGFAEPVRVAGGDGGSACAPAALADGRILFSYAPDGGDFGLCVATRDGRGFARVLDLPGTDEMDAVPLEARARPPVLRPAFAPAAGLVPAAQFEDLRRGVNTFRFDCLNVFMNAPVDAPIPDAPRYAHGLRIQFFTTLSRPRAAGGDTVVLVRDAGVEPDGGVHVDNIPADTPLFEQLVDSHGRVVRSASGPAHVPGFNAGRFGTGTKCVGCHVGHSAIAVPMTYTSGSRINFSPSAEVEATSTAPGTAGPRAAVDRRAKGPAADVAWIAESRSGQRLRLSWPYSIAVDSVVVYAIHPNSSQGTDLRIRGCELVLLRDGSPVRRIALDRGVSPGGTSVACGGTIADALEVVPTRVTGKVLRQQAVGLAEVETIARIAE